MQRKMTEKDFTVEDATALMTTTHQDATGSDVTSSSSRGADFYFQSAVVIIGIVGTAANAVVLYALVASEQHKKQLLIVNVNALDLLSCVFLVVTYSAKLCNIRLTGTSGHWLCATLLSEAFAWWGIIGSRIGLAIVTVDRYLKVVHYAWSQKWVRKWMTYVAVAFSWIGALVYSFSVNFTTTAVVNGACYAAVVWQSEVVKMVHGVWNFVSFYVVILSIVIFCYWRILVVIRRQARVMASHGSTIGQAQFHQIQTNWINQQPRPFPPDSDQLHQPAARPSSTGSRPTASTSGQAQFHQIQTNVIKTMIIVSAFYAVTGFPVDCYFLLVNVNAECCVTLDESSYHGTMFILFLYSCSNPFIYAIKFDPVKRTLLGLIPCKTPVQPSADLNAA